MNQAIQSVFADLIASAVLVDGVYFVPLVDAFGSLAGITLFIGVMFGVIFEAARFLAEGAFLLIRTLGGWIGRKFFPG